MFNLFKQKEAFLYNGKKVKEGDKVFFINSDGERLEGVIERRKQGCATYQKNITNLFVMS